MLDDLRNSSSFIDEEETTSEPIEAVRRPMRRSQKGTFLGLTAQQRFIISVMLFVMVCLLGVAALYITESIYLPF